MDLSIVDAVAGRCPHGQEKASVSSPCARPVFLRWTARSLLGLAFTLPLAAHAVEDGDILYAFCRATDIDSARVFYSDVFPVQRRHFYDNDTFFAIAFSKHVDARRGTRTGHPARRGCWYEEQELDARMKRDSHAVEQRRAIHPFEPVYVRWRP